MRDDLYRLAQILATTLLADHRFVNLAGSEVIHLLHLGSDEALIVAEIQIGFSAVIGDEHFAVLEWAHRSRINVDVGIELQKGDSEAARFEDRSEGRGGNPFTQGRHDAASDKYKLGHYKEVPNGTCGKFKLYLKPPAFDAPVFGQPQISGRETPCFISRKARPESFHAWRRPLLPGPPWGTDGHPESVENTAPPAAWSRPGRPCGIRPNRRRRQIRSAPDIDDVSTRPGGAEWFDTRPSRLRG